MLRTLRNGLSGVKEDSQPFKRTIPHTRDPQFSHTDRSMLPVLGTWTKLSIELGLLITTLALLWPTLLSYLIKQEMQLRPGSKSFEHWRETPVPMYIDIYFHNWTNPDRMATEIPHFTQMGPYRFYEKRTKVDLEWNANNTVSYRQTRHWYFDEDHSNGTLEDRVTNINMVPLTIGHMTRFRSELDRRQLSYGFTLSGQQLAITKSVGELLFRGYSDAILTFLNRMPFLPDGAKPPKDKFGWFYERNGSKTVDGVFNMDTGARDLSSVGTIRTWNYHNRTDFFPEQCGAVAGTSGEVFPPYLSKTDTIGLFSGDLCRTIFLNFSEESEVTGVRGLKFTADNGLVASTSCFVQGERTPRGLLNITECRGGIPVYISYPHFYLGDETLVHGVGGMKPDQNNHEFSITIEPTFGVPIDVKGRFQINTMVEPSEDILLYRDIPRRYFMPILWFDQRASLTPALNAEIKSMVLLYSLSTSAAFGLLLMGMILAAGGITAACRKLNRAPPSKTSPLQTACGCQQEEFICRHTV